MALSSGLLALFLVMPALGAGDDPKGEPTTPDEQYQALVKEAEKAQQDFTKAMLAARPEERQALLKKAPNFGPKFLALAEKYPKDPVAIDALQRVVSDFRPGGSDPSVKKALDILARDHRASEKLGGVCDGLGMNLLHEGAENFLLAVMEKNPRKDIQAAACLMLAEQAYSRCRMSEDLKDGLVVKAYTELHGKEAVDALAKADVKKLEEASEKYYRAFADNYAGVLPGRRVMQAYLLPGFSGDAIGERALRALLAKDTRKEIQGPASLWLARVLFERASSLPDGEAKEAAKLLAECERLLEDALAKYADATVERGRFSDTVGARAKTQLFALRNLSVGKVAPDIVGEDQDGKPLKLSDYRGKVVLLDFWGPNCLA
jgi:hypothetical protein